MLPVVELTGRSQTIKGTGRGKKRVAEAVVVEEAMQVCSKGVPVECCAAVEDAFLVEACLERCKGICAIQIASFADVDFIAAHM